MNPNRPKHDSKSASLMLLFVLSVALFSGTYAQAQSLESYALDPRIWTGEIIIDRIGSADIKQDNSQSNAHVVKTYKESRRTYEHWRIKACGEAGELYILKVDAELSENSEIKRTFKERSRNCSVKKPDLRKPGNSGHRTVIHRASRYEGADCPPPEKISTVLLMIWPGGRYVLNFTGGAYMAHQQDEVDYTKWICDGHITQLEFHLIPIGINEKEHATTRNTDEGANVHPNVF